jgi:hypothetical protein
MVYCSRLYLQLPHLPGRTQLKTIGKLLDHYSGVLCVASPYAAAPYGFFYWLDETLADAAKASLGRFCRERVSALIQGWVEPFAKPINFANRG